jgi:ketosteroid isomerase-like protein
MSNAERLTKLLAPIFGSGETEMNQGVIDRITAALNPITTDEFTVLMRGDESFLTTYTGRQAAPDAWADWLEAFDQVRLELEELEETGENVVTFVRQVGRTRHGVEIEQPSAAVWKFRGEQLVRVEFHLDRGAARDSAQIPA